MEKLRICIVTGSRADYGLLYCLMKLIQSDRECNLQLAVTGMHLSPEFGLTYRDIERDGFTLDAKVETLLSSDSSVGIAKSIGLGVGGFAEAFARLSPHIIVVLGDRYEILAAAQAALIARIPIAHIAGGDVTEGSIDELIRHSLTKMSQLHFVTNQVSGQRVVQMGEDPGSVHVVGSPGIDYLKQLKLLSRADLEAEIGFQFRKRNLLITFHPATADAVPAPSQYKEVLDAVESFDNDTGLFFTMTNSDHGGRELIDMTERFVSRHENGVAFVSLGQMKYLSLVAQVDAVVGNSSSGLYEVPSLKKPTVNIGDRQKGRPAASSVIQCPPVAAMIKEAILKAFKKDCSTAINPFGGGDASEKILTVLKNHPGLSSLLRKKFYDLPSKDRQ